MIDITRAAVWTLDCQGKQDLDFSILSANTRYWPDFTAHCTITFLDDYNTQLGEYTGRVPIVVAESDILKGENEEQVKMLVRKWYNEHIVATMEEVIKLLRKEEEK